MLSQLLGSECRSQPAGFESSKAPKADFLLQSSLCGIVIDGRNISLPVVPAWSMATAQNLSPTALKERWYWRA